VALNTDMDAVLSALQDFQGNTTFTAILPEMTVPPSGSVAYQISVFIEDSLGMPADPDGDSITVSVENGADVDRSSNLSAPTMTKVGVGHYEVFYNVAFNATIEQLLFEFDYLVSGTPFARVRTITLGDSQNIFTAADRIVLNSISTDTRTSLEEPSATLLCIVSLILDPSWRMALVMKRIALPLVDAFHVCVPPAGPVPSSSSYAEVSTFQM
jgi:hypothetical protein